MNTTHIQGPILKPQNAINYKFNLVLVILKCISVVFTLHHWPHFFHCGAMPHWHRIALRLLLRFLLEKLEQLEKGLDGTLTSSFCAIIPARIGVV